MSWARFEATMATHRKVLAVSNDALAVHVTGLLWSVDHLTDGALTTADADSICNLRRLTGAKAKRVLAELEAQGLWHRTDAGWVLHDFHDYQPTADEERRRKADAADRQRRKRERGTAAVSNGDRGRFTRRHAPVTRDDQRDKPGDSDVTTGVSHPLTEPEPSTPPQVPLPAPADGGDQVPSGRSPTAEEDTNSSWRTWQLGHDGWTTRLHDLPEADRAPAVARALALSDQRNQPPGSIRQPDRWLATATVARLEQHAGIALEPRWRIHHAATTLDPNALDPWDPTGHKTHAQRTLDIAAETEQRRLKHEQRALEPRADIDAIRARLGPRFAKPDPTPRTPDPEPAPIVDPVATTPESDASDAPGDAAVEPAPVSSGPCSECGRWSHRPSCSRAGS